MFSKRKNRALSDAINRAQDPDLRVIEEQIAERKDRLADLELELSDTRISLRKFEAEYDRKIGPLERRLKELQLDLDDARRKAERRAQWGDKEIPVDVIEQFRKTWKRSERPLEEPIERPTEPQPSEDIKRLFRTLAKRFHPDLVTDALEKRTREKKMAEINRAYAAKDYAALRAILELGEPSQVPPQKSRLEILSDLQKELHRLNAVIVRMETELQELILSPIVQLMLDTTMARRQGRDLLSEIERDLTREISSMQAEIASLQSRS